MQNQNPEQIAGDFIDKQLTACGWLNQGSKKLNFDVFFSSISTHETNQSARSKDPFLSQRSEINTYFKALIMI